MTKKSTFCLPILCIGWKFLGSMQLSLSLSGSILHNPFSHSTSPLYTQLTEQPRTTSSHTCLHGSTGFSTPCTHFGTLTEQIRNPTYGEHRSSSVIVWDVSVETITFLPGFDGKAIVVLIPACTQVANKSESSFSHSCPCDVISAKDTRSRTPKMILSISFLASWIFLLFFWYYFLSKTTPKANLFLCQMFVIFVLCFS